MPLLYFSLHIAPIILIIGILFFTVQLIRKKVRLQSISAISGITLSIIIPALLIANVQILISCGDGCSFNKYSPHWLATMTGKTVGNIPLISSIDKAQYSYRTSNIECWEVVYKSVADLNVVKTEITDYLVRKDAELDANVSCYNGVWETTDETVIIRCKFKGKCVVVYLDDNVSFVLVRAFEI